MIIVHLRTRVERNSESLCILNISQTMNNIRYNFFMQSYWSLNPRIGLIHIKRVTVKECHKFGTIATSLSKYRPIFALRLTAYPQVAKRPSASPLMKINEDISSIEVTILWAPYPDTFLRQFKYMAATRLTGSVKQLYSILLTWIHETLQVTIYLCLWYNSRIEMFVKTCNEIRSISHPHALYL